MDGVSHAVIGAAIGEFHREPRRGRLLWPMLFAFLPDACQVLFLYPYVGALNQRPLWIPHHEDWDGFRDAHPWASAVWEAPHGFPFLLLVIVPIVIRFDLPRTCIAAYASHLVLDVVTHAGEWSSTPFWPLPWRVPGFTDAWRWPPWAWALSIAACSVIWLTARRVLRTRITPINGSSPPPDAGRPSPSPPSPPRDRDPRR